ncbi:MAG: hypothetical protein JXR89_12745, partial [Deltaproteobacteria bacterium]|nr:hypothetical protein [Deltaproteobacteria bacterium]
MVYLRQSLSTATQSVPLSQPCGRDAASCLQPEVVTFMRREIELAGGNEVFFQARLISAKVVEAKVLARGNQNMTPALSRRLRPGEAVIHNHPSGNLSPSDADLRVASLLAADDIAFLIVDNTVSLVYTVVEPMVESAVEPLSPDLVEKYFSPAGELAANLPGYEFRAEQTALARGVLQVFNDSGFLLAEAGTGVGKSLAYLIPAALWAIRRQQRVVISTNTINLQEQLLDKDLPVLIRDLGLPVKAVLVKGRANYLCRRRLQ